jgi:hypothetical protein
MYYRELSEHNIARARRRSLIMRKLRWYLDAGYIKRIESGKNRTPPTI